MVLDTNDLTEALAQLDQEGGDNLHLEAKTFSEYSSSSIAPTLSAFANLPGGGTILLGVTEKPLNVVGVSHPHELAKRVSNLARNGFSSPIGVDVRTIRLGSLTVLAVNVRESSDRDKPCRWRETKYAYLRQYDGDYRMSSQEEQQLLLRHTRPREDSHSVAATGKEDLDAGLVATFVGNVRRGSTALANATEEDILLNLNVVTEDGTLTRAGLYALGTYPQRFLPALSITAAYLPGPEAVDGVRATDRLDLTGSVPAMLDAAVSWVDRVADRTIRFRHGHGYDQAEYPSLVVRELVANALVHRDLSEPALTKRVEIRLLRDKLVIGSPGGLYGLSVDQLGTRDGKSAVNEYLYQICTFVSAIASSRASAQESVPPSRRWPPPTWSLSGSRTPVCGSPRSCHVRPSCSPRIWSGWASWVPRTSPSPSATPWWTCGTGPPGRTPATDGALAWTPCRPGRISTRSSPAATPCRQGPGAPRPTPSRPSPPTRTSPLARPSAARPRRGFPPRRRRRPCAG